VLVDTHHEALSESPSKLGAHEPVSRVQGAFLVEGRLIPYIYSLIADSPIESALDLTKVTKNELNRGNKVVVLIQFEGLKWGDSLALGSGDEDAEMGQISSPDRTEQGKVK
jgi:hypothetical protein